MWQFADGGTARPWERVDSPVAVTLHDAAVTTVGPCAVGNGGSVVARAPDGTWGVVVADGPSARGEALYAVDVTDDGERLWFAGANGALGSYEIASNTRLDRSEPRDVTDTFGALAVAGERGAEKLLVADGSGRVYAAEVSGTTIDWEGTSRPAGDTAIGALDATAGGVGYAVDANATIYRTTATDGWERVGVEGAENSFYAVSATSDRLLVGGGNGRVYRARPDETAWTPSTLGDFSVRALAATGDRAVAAGTDGAIYSYRGGWTRDAWDGSVTIEGLALGDVDVAAGANGLLLERSD